MADGNNLFAPFTTIDGRFTFSDDLQLVWKRDSGEVRPLTKAEALGMCIHLPKPKDGKEFIEDHIGENGYLKNRYIVPAYPVKVEAK